MRRGPALLLAAGATLLVAWFLWPAGSPPADAPSRGETDAGSSSAISDAAGTSEPSAEEAEEEPLPSGRFRFVDVTEESGLGAFRQVCGAPDKPLIVETIGGGVALFDADGDGHLDAYLTNGSFFGASEEDAPRDALYRGDGTGSFTDVTEQAGVGETGWTNGVRVVDYDADGWPDLYLTNYGPNVLYRNRGDGTFEDVTEATGVGDPGWSTGACFLDFDRDGDLDLFVSNYVDFDEEEMLRDPPMVSYKGVDVMKGPRGLPEAHDSFYVNEGGTFRDASEELGVRAKKLFSFQCVAFDADEDGWVDIYVANDSVENVLYRNLEGKGFEDVAFLTGLALSVSGKPQAGMGVAVGDFDADLLPDLYVTNFADDYFTLYRGTPRDYFVDATHRLRLAEATKPSLGWGCGLEDFDADGGLEIYVVNGHVYPQVDQFDFSSGYAQENLLFAYEGGTFQRVDGGPGFRDLRTSRGSAVGDVDEDGDLDLLIGNLDGPPTLLRNDSEVGNHLLLEIVGAGGNRDAVGTRVVVTVGERRCLRLVATAGSFLSSSAPELFVGLGAAEQAERIEVFWPDGTEDSLSGVAANQRVTIEQAAGAEGEARVSFRAR